MCLVVDWAPRLFAEAGIDFGMVKGKAVQVKELELVDHESQDPGMLAGLMGKALLCAGMKGMSSWLNS